MIVEFWTELEKKPLFQQAKRWIDLAAPWILLVVAILYYASYYRSGLNLSGEGGTIAVYAQRLNEGQKPFIDTFLGYNLFWFYPVAWLFEAFGDNYIALRIYFFAICTVAALLCYTILRRTTGIAWFSFGVALLPLIMPGMLFRNYLPFLAVLNTLCLVETWIIRRSGKKNWLILGVAAGAALALTALIRIDLAVFFLVIHCGLAALNLLTPGQRFVGLLTESVTKLILIGGIAFLLHLPVVWHAEKGGFREPFVEQYALWVGLIRYNFEKEIATPIRQALQSTPQDASVAEAPGVADQTELPISSSSVEQQNENNSGSVMARRPLQDGWTLPRIYDRTFVWSLYLPIPISICLVAWGLGSLAWGLWYRDPQWFQRGLTLLALTGGALTLFPQYFFFRPDLAHLSEMMVPFYVAMGFGVYLAVWVIIKHRSRPLLWVPALGLVLICLFDGIAYPYYAVPKELAGTNAANRGRTERFQAENGVDVLLKKKDVVWMTDLYNTIMENSRDGEYLVCYPYQPMLNFLTDRPSYQWNLYVDDVTAEPDFHEKAVADIKKYRPAVIVIDNRAINNTEFSKFSNWAAATYEFIRANYQYAGKFQRNEVYIRGN